MNGNDSTMLRADPMERAMESDRPAVAQAGRTSRGIIAISLVVICILGCYWPTVMSIVAIWSRSPTFTHGYLIVPIVLWLVWRDRRRLAAIPVLPCFPAQLLLALCGVGWLIAELAGVLGGMQFMVAAMIPAVVWAIGGTAMVRALTFPLAYLFFAVPLGEFMVPALQDWTADFAILALRLSGIPVLREGLNFSIPTGRWSVVEECSGINYLIASVAIGTLYTYLTHRSNRRRLVFVCLFAVVPLVSNGLRAYLIVLIAHLSQNRIATGIDHIWLGWALFGAVMALMFWIVSCWRETETRVDAVPQLDTSTRVGASDTRIIVAVAVTLLMVWVWRPAAALIESPNAKASVQLAEVSGVGGWNSAGSRLIDWDPEYAHPTSSLSRVFTKGSDAVGLYILLYRNQDEERKLVTSANQLIKSQNKRWRVVASGSKDIEFVGTGLSVKTTEFTDGVDRMEAWHWYRVDGHFTASDMLAKIYLAISKLRGRGDDSSLVVIIGRKHRYDGSRGDALDDFAAAMGGAIERTLSDAEAR